MNNWHWTAQIVLCQYWYIMSQEVLQFYIDFQNNCINLYIKSHYYSINTIIVYVINNATFYMDDVISPLHPPILPSLLVLLPSLLSPLL